MSKRAIVNAASKKGIVFDVCAWNFAATPGRMVPGWTIQPTEDSLGRLEIAGADADDLYRDDFETTEEVLAWIDAMPDVREVLA